MRSETSQTEGCGVLSKFVLERSYSVADISLVAAERNARLLPELLSQGTVQMDSNKDVGDIVVVACREAVVTTNYEVGNVSI
jgi:hypothetical protein